MKTLITITALALAPLAVQADPNCGTREEAYEIVREDFDERRVAMGYTGEGLLFELWANDDTGTWTTLLINDAGNACIMDEGEAFFLNAASRKGDPA